MKIFKRETPFDNALAAVRATVKEREHLSSLLEAAHAERAQHQTKLSAIRIGLEDAEVAAVCGTGGSTDGLRAELAGLYAAGDAVEARITGLKRRLAESDSQLERTQAKFQAARADWNREQIAAFSERYLKVVDEFRSITRQAAALGAALGEEMLTQAARDNSAFSLLTGESILEQPRYVAYGAPDYSPNWEADPKSMAVFEASKGPRLADAELSRSISEVSMRQAREAARARDEAVRQKAEQRIKEAAQQVA